MYPLYVVINEESLGYINNSRSGNYVGVLSGDPRTGPAFCTRHEVRPATTDDFDKFRVYLHPHFRQTTNADLDTHFSQDGVI